jgi:serpin B
LQAVALPYDQERFRMLVFLPDEGSSLAALIGSLTGGNWEAWMRQFTFRSVDLRLPRFTATGDFDLKTPLAALGMGLAFDPSHADFSGMMAEGTAISEAKHSAHVVVDEAGTEAAAVTMMGMAKDESARGRERPVPFVVDRPFMCAIEDIQTQVIVFMGVIVDPKA